ncbi:ABC transporter transmembrane domain-containing protein [Thalassospira sp. TSL5-1]|uniref:ABC transporter transmembrane domain-containing protein n=1 Tax=Thalassospira sp. TSL5-1 TaxID=1544451 RepID=UPI000938E322|nr:ABC transporter transmembrane domain-containing protein [Thalassospira sp. TSL5-1]OKH88818.1 multidrug transporter [Thalassospira sp. TSL5-1]
MPQSVFAYIWRHSRFQQIVLLIITVLSFPFLYYSLDLPKMIVNKAIGGAGEPFDILGIELNQVEYLFSLSGIFLALVFINGGFKYLINVYTGVMAERLLRRMRYILYERILRFPLPHFRKTSQGEIVSMITAEAEPLGGFFGEAFSLPVYQGGILITISAFIFIQDPLMGLAAVSFYPLQGYIIPKLQRRVNQLGKDRVQNIRRLSEHIGDTVSGATDIRAHNTQGYELMRYTQRMGRIFEIRKEIYFRKFFIKFLNNFIAQITPFFFYSIGGYLVIQGDLSFGALVAALAAYKDMSAPWKELLAYYQRLADAHIKYDQLYEQFELPDLDQEHELTAPLADHLKSPLDVYGVSWMDDDGTRVVENVSFNMPLPGSALLTGTADSGKSHLARLLVRLLNPSSGRIQFADVNAAQLPASFLGQRTAYVGPDSYLFHGTISDNLLYGLKHRPQIERDDDTNAGKTAAKDQGMATDDSQEETGKLLPPKLVEEVKLASPTDLPDHLTAEMFDEIKRSGNIPYDPSGQWIDYTGPGYESLEQLNSELLSLLSVVHLDRDIYRIGLFRRIDPKLRPNLSQAVLAARPRLKELLAERGLADLVEPFDINRYNDNATVGINLIFGVPVNPNYERRSFLSHPYFLGVLRDNGLYEPMINMGRNMLDLMIELFTGLPPGHEFFDRYSFISADELTEVKHMLKRIDGVAVSDIGEEDQLRLLEVAMNLTPARHRLRVMDDNFRDMVLKARPKFHENIPDDLVREIDFFDADNYTASASILDNLLFGRFAYGRAHSEERVGEVLFEIARDGGLYEALISLGLESDVGVGGSRVSQSLRQKITLVRALIKNPDILVIDEALSAIDNETRDQVVKYLTKSASDLSVIWVDGADMPSEHFSTALHMSNGKLTRRDTHEAITPDPTTDAAAITAESDIGPTEDGSIEEEVRLLRTIPLFSALDPNVIKLLAFTSPRLTYKRGEVIVKQGEPGDAAFIVISGRGEIWLTTDEAQTLKLRDVEPKEVIGEIALLVDQPRSATIRAVEDMTVLKLDKAEFLGLVRQDQAVSVQLLRVLAERLDLTTKQLSNRD